MFVSRGAVDAADRITPRNGQASRHRMLMKIPGCDYEVNEKYSTTKSKISAKRWQSSHFT